MSHRFDRFQEPDEPKQVATCEQCGGEIYEGDEVYPLDENAGFGYGFVHNNGRCAEDYAIQCLFGDGGTINRTGEIE